MKFARCLVVSLVCLTTLSACGADVESVDAQAHAAPGVGGLGVYRPEYVVQGQMGDCWLLSSLAAMAQARPKQLESMIEQTSADSWVVHMRGQDVRVTTAELVNNGAQVVRDSNGDAILWPAIMEAAAASYFQGHFGELTGGDAGKALDAMNVDTQDLAFNSTSGAHLTKLLSLVAAGYPMVLSSNDAQDDGSPVIASHSYTVMQVIDQNHIIVRNPWGTGGPANDGIMTLSIETILQVMPRLTVPLDAVKLVYKN